MLFVNKGTVIWAISNRFRFLGSLKYRYAMCKTSTNKTTQQISLVIYVIFIQISKRNYNTLINYFVIYLMYSLYLWMKFACSKRNFIFYAKT